MIRPETFIWPVGAKDVAATAHNRDVAENKIKLRKRPRVFALEPWGKLNLTDAERFGRLHYLFPAPNKRPNIWSDEFCRRTVDELEEHGYNPDVDYILVVGAVANLALFLCQIAARFGRVRLLLWCGIEGQYVARNIRG